jgi:hypothetical protein
MIGRPRPHRRIVSLLLLILLPACYNWEVVATRPVQQEDVPSGRVRVRRTDGTEIKLARTSVTADTLTGVLRSSGRTRYTEGIPLADIQWLETPEVAVVETVMLSVGVVLVVGFVIGCAATNCLRWDYSFFEN